MEEERETERGYRGREGGRVGEREGKTGCRGQLTG